MIDTFVVEERILLHTFTLLADSSAAGQQNACRTCISAADAWLFTAQHTWNTSVHGTVMFRQIDYLELCNS
jgi:hypothetical protein